LGLLNRFRKKKEEEEALAKTPEVATELEQLCGDDKITYQALLETMFLDPRKIEVSMKEAVENAEKLKKEKDFVRAKAWYEIAGGLAIYEGNVKKVVEYFGECERLSPDTKYLILENPEKAVAKAQEYYQKYLKT